MFQCRTFSGEHKKVVYQAMTVFSSKKCHRGRCLLQTFFILDESDTVWTSVFVKRKKLCFVTPN